MNWKDTLIKSSDIKWRHPRIKHIDDGKVDFILKIPFADILEKQAQISFLSGIKDYNNFVVELLSAEIPLKEMRTKIRERLGEYGFNMSSPPSRKGLT